MTVNTEDIFEVFCCKISEPAAKLLNRCNVWLRLSDSDREWESSLLFSFTSNDKYWTNISFCYYLDGQSESFCRLQSKCCYHLSTVIIQRTFWIDISYHTYAWCCTPADTKTSQKCRENVLSLVSETF